jgi:hypothetical protein
MSNADLSGKRVESSEDAEHLGSAHTVESRSGLSLAQREEFLEKEKKRLSQELDKFPRQEGVPNEARDKTVIALIATQEMLREVKEVKSGGRQVSTVSEAASSSRSSQTAQPEVGVERMTIMKIRNSKTLTESRQNQGLFAEWLSVHSKDYNDLLPFDEKELVDLLNQWEGNPQRKELLASRDKTNRESWVKQRSEWLVFKALVDGVEAQQENGAKLDRLFENFKAVGVTDFKYTMDALSSDKFLQGGREGDCNTLMHAFQEICKNVLGIDCEKRSSTGEFKGRFLTKEHRTIDGLTGNVDGKDCKYWVFENHYWIHFEGKDYDVLFGESGTVDKSGWRPMKNNPRDEVWIFGDEPDQVKVRLINGDVVQGRYRQVE